MYDALAAAGSSRTGCGSALAGAAAARGADGRIVLAVDVSPWLRPDAPTSARAAVLPRSTAAAKGNAQMIPGWPYSFVAALETGRTSWTAVLDAVRLGPADDATAVTAAQLRELVDRLRQAGHCRDGDPDILIVLDTGYDITRLAYRAGRPAGASWSAGCAPTGCCACPRRPGDPADRAPAPTRPGDRPGRPGHLAHRRAHQHHRHHPLRHRPRAAPGTGCTPG